MYIGIQIINIDNKLNYELRAKSEVTTVAIFM